METQPLLQCLLHLQSLHLPVCSGGFLILLTRSYRNSGNSEMGCMCREFWRTSDRAPRRDGSQLLLSPTHVSSGMSCSLEEMETPDFLEPSPAETIRHGCVDLRVDLQTEAQLFQGGYSQLFDGFSLACDVSLYISVTGFPTRKWAFQRGKVLG